MSWAATLHRLWLAVTAIESREELADLVLPPLQALPGVRAVWGLRQGSGDRVLEYRWTGLPLEGEFREVARAMARDVDKIPTTLHVGGLTGIASRFDVSGEASGTVVVIIDEAADTAVIAERLQQVIEATREAVRRLGARRAEQLQQTGDALLAEASLQMDAVLDAEQTMRRVPRMAVPAIAEGCLVYVAENGKPVLRSSVHVDMRRLARLLADPVVAGRLTSLAGSAILDGRPRRGDPAMLAARSVDVQVLRARGRVIGVLVFLFDRADDRIPTAAFLRDLASRAALAIDNGELYEQRRREVVTLQQHLLPTRLPVVEGLAMAASYTVGDRVLEVGGDFYDVVAGDDGTVAALIGDVCGRGVDAAALTGMARNTLAALLQEGASPGRAMRRLNSRLRLDGSWRFVTAGVALLRRSSEETAVDWTSAGHPAPIVMRRGRAAERGAGGGAPLGVLTEARISASQLVLRPGDTLIFFTDGLTESRDTAGEMFEDHALWETLERLRDVPVDVLVGELSRAAVAFGATRPDDIAILAIRAEGDT